MRNYNTSVHCSLYSSQYCMYVRNAIFDPALTQYLCIPYYPESKCHLSKYVTYEKVG